jgi:hypothetical protein
MALRDALLDWVDCQHAARDQEAGAFAPDGDYPMALTDSAAADRAALGIPAGSAASGWRGVVLLEEQLRCDEEPLRLSLKLRTTGRQGREHPTLATVRLFVTRGLTDDEIGKATTAVAVMDDWDTDEQRCAVLAPLVGSSAPPVAVSDDLMALSMRFELRGARVLSLVELAKLKADGNLRILTEAQWAKDVAEAEERKPSRVASMPNFHLPAARASLRAGMVIDTDAPLPTRWCVAVLRACRGVAPEGRMQDAKAVFVDTAVKMRLTITAVDSGGEPAAGPPLVTLESSTRCYSERAATDAMLADFGTGSAKHGAGLYFFEPQTVACLGRPGSYRLTFSIAAPLAGVAVAPLVCTLQRHAPRLRRALDADAIWSVCCHPGDCVTQRGRGAVGCARLEAALEAGDADVVLKGPPMRMKLYFTQRLSSGAEVGFPDDVASGLQLSVWDNDADEQQPIRVTAAALRPADIELTSEGRELVISNVRLTGGVLSTGDALDDKNANAQKRAPHRGSGVFALLRVGLACARVEQTDSDIALYGAAEVPIRVMPGVAASIVFAPGPGMWCASGEEHEPEAYLVLRAALVDECGNAAVRLRVMPADDDEAPQRLALELSRMVSGRDVIDGTIVLVEKPGERDAGTARVRLRVTACFGQTFSVTLRARGLRTAAKLEGIVPARTLRLVVPRGTRLHGRAAALLSALTTVQARVCTVSTDRSTLDAGFTGSLLFSAAPGAPAEWCAMLAQRSAAVADGIATLPQLPLPAVPGRFKLLVRLRHAPEGGGAAQQALDIEAAAAPPATLVAKPCGDEARAGETLRFEFSALCSAGAPTTVSEALLAALQPAGVDAAAMTILRRELLHDGAAAAITLRVSCAPGDVAVRLAAPAQEDGAAALEVGWRVCLEAGPPVGAVSAPCVLTQGDALAAHDVAFVDAGGHECGAACDSCVLEIEPAHWLLVDAPGAGASASTALQFSVRGGVATLTGLRVARSAPVGVHQLAARLLPATASAPRAGSQRRGGGGRTLAQPEPLFDFNLPLDIRAGRHPCSLLLSCHDELVIEAGASVMPTGTVHALDTSAAPVPPGHRLPALSLLLLPAGVAPSDPRVQRGAVLVAATSGAAGGAYDCDAATAAAAPLSADAKAGEYVLHYKLPMPNGAPALASRRVHVIAASTGPLQCAFAAKLPACVEARADGDGDADSELLAAALEVHFTDAHGNDVDLSTALQPHVLRVRFERVDADAEAPPLPQPPAVKRQVSEAEHVAAAARGRVTLHDVRAASAWPSGRYRLAVDLRPEAWRVRPAQPFLATPSHEFTFIGAEEAQAGRDIKRRAAEAAAAVTAALEAVNAAEAAVLQATRDERAAATAVRDAQTTSAAAAAARNRAADTAQRCAADAAPAAAVVAAARAQRWAATPPINIAAAPLHVAEYVSHRVGGDGAIHGHTPVELGGLGASLDDNSDVMCQLWELLRAETPEIGAALCHAAGGSGLGMLICRTNEGMQLGDARLPDTGCHMRLCHTNMQKRFWTRGVQAGHPQAPLAGLPDIRDLPGCLGYVVNLVHLTPAQLAARVLWEPPQQQQQQQAGACGSGRRGAPPTPTQPRWVGLRESVLYYVFGSRMLFENDEALRAFERQHKDRADKCDGLRSLSDRSVAQSGVVHGRNAIPPPRFFTPPCVRWEERAAVRIAALCVCLPALLHRADARPSPHVPQSTLLAPLRDALQTVAAAAAAAAEAAAAEAAAAAAEAAQQGAVHSAASLRAALTERQQAARDARAQYDALHAAAAAAASGAPVQVAAAQTSAPRGNRRR